MSKGRKGHLATLCSFGAIQAAQMVLPLLALPWLARALGPDAFGVLMFVAASPGSHDMRNPLIMLPCLFAYAVAVHTPRQGANS